METQDTDRSAPSSLLGPMMTCNAKLLRYVYYDKYGAIKVHIYAQVAKLRDLLNDEFHFKTEYYEIPSERWETALHKRLADFCYEYDSPEDLAIIYYGGHAYEGEETKEFKLAA